MAAKGTTFGKMERDRAKKAKAAAKRERREERATSVGDEPTDAGRGSQDEVLERLAVLHEQFDGGRIDLEAFETEKAVLLASLAVE